MVLMVVVVLDGCGGVNICIEELLVKLGMLVMVIV